MSMTLRFVLFVAFLLAFVAAGTRPEDMKWLQAKALEDGVVATGTGLLYKGTCCTSRRWIHMSCGSFFTIASHEYCTLR